MNFWYVHTYGWILLVLSWVRKTRKNLCMISFIWHSVQFSHSFMSDSLWPHGLQHARLPCPSPTPRAYSNSCSLSRWCHPTISSSVVPFSSRLQSFQHQRLFQRVSSLHQVAKVLEPQLQHQSLQRTLRTDFFRMDWLDLLAFQGTVKSLLQHHSSETLVTH